MRRRFVFSVGLVLAVCASSDPLIGAISSIQDKPVSSSLGVENFAAGMKPLTEETLKQAIALGSSTTADDLVAMTMPVMIYMKLTKNKLDDPKVMARMMALTKVPFTV